MAIVTTGYIPQTIESIHGFNLTDGTVEFVMEDLQDATVSNTQDTVEYTGKNGAVIYMADRNKRSTISANNGKLTDGALAAQIGAIVESGTMLMDDWFDTIVTTDGTTAVTEHTAQGAVGAEISGLYKNLSDGSLGQKFTQAAVASATEFSYDPSTKEITLPTGAFAAGESMTAVYTVSVEGAKRITNNVDNYSKTLKIVAEALFVDNCGVTYGGRIVYPRAKCDGNFDLSFGSDGYVHAFSAQALYGGCNIGGQQTLWYMEIYDSEEIA